MIHLHLSDSAFSLLSSEFIAVLRFLNLVHCGCVREVLDLAWGTSSLFLLLLNRVLDTDILLNTQLLHVFMELFNAFNHFLIMDHHLFLEVVSVDLNFSILKVELSCYLFGPGFSIDLPALLALGHPLLHEGLILPQLLHIVLSFALLDTPEHILF